MSTAQYNEGNVLKHVVKLPLVSSALQQAFATYMDVKGHYPLLGFMGSVAELGIRSAYMAATQQAAPLLQNLKPEIEAVNNFALVGLEQLEKFFPILQQPTDEVVANLKNAFFSRMDHAQSRMNDELDRVVDTWDKMLELSLRLLEAAQKTATGRVIAAGLDELITQSEEAVAYYLPLPPTMRHEWERRVQSYEDEEDSDDEEEEPRMWTRIRSLLLCVYLQLYHKLMKLRERVDSVLQTLGAAAETVGLMRLMEMVTSLLQLLLTFYISQVHRIEELRSLLMAQLASGIQALKGLPPVQQMLDLPAQVRNIMSDLLELGQILIQLLINTTPLYDLVKQVSDLDAINNPTSDELPESPSNRVSANSLFLKAMDGRLHRRRSLYTRSRRGSASGPPVSPALSPTPTTVPNGRKGSLKIDAQISDPPELDTLAVPTTDMIRRRSSTAEVLLAPIMQLVSQSQRAFEFLSTVSSSEDQVIPVKETTEQ
ncbi:perilipin-2-like [Myxocyprinus asiaticus]|uniref:perilipin-2-like n=1 Tax=Myxocyprinus asiaticus TaxID=70543 RepID=UPI002222D60C|nr:perilipin-2-like [Myxocyprinus asiaticus]XP_051574420.1 perilipin-2-like [Myxocyprinus asiaticus]